MSQLEDLLQQCTVKITVPGGGWGTGFFVAPGLILTCAHVVRKAADSPVTVSYSAWQQSLAAIVKAKADDGKTLDLALVELVEPLPDHPCVLLDDEPVAIGQALYSYGYLESYTNAAPVRPVNEGLTGDTPPLLKLQGAQIERGISGAALLNLESGQVCGMVKETRAAGFDLGGGAIPTRVILEQFPELCDLQQVFHGSDQRWVNLITPPGIDFQPYLTSVATTYAKWWEFYTLTDAESRQRQVQGSAPIFDFGLTVHMVPKSEQEELQGGKQEKEKVERFSVLDGLRKYALGEKPEPVLLVGRPGSGKSTALARLMLEEVALTLSPSPHPGRGEPKRIPVLVELRYWQGSLADLIHNAIARHDPALRAVPLDQLLTHALILFDGVNELPFEEARTQLSAFRRDYPKLPMIFTTRDLSLGGDLGIERRLEMQPLTEPQMQAFIRAYIPAQAEAMLRQLKNRLREFGQTPLLLWMLCEVFQQAPNNQLPSNLGGVFQAFTQMYEASSVRKHEVALLKGDVRPLSDRRLWKKALMAIASIMMQGKTSVDFRVAIHREEAETELSRFFSNETFPVRDIVDDLLKYHLLQNRSANQIEFRHQLIQEYYAAEYLLRLLPALSDEQLKQNYLNYLKWTEPIALMLAMETKKGKALRVVKQSLMVDWQLAARIAGEVKPEFQAKAVQAVETLDTPSWLKIQLLKETRSKAAIPGLLTLLEDPDSDVRYKAVEALGKIGTEEAVSALLRLLEDVDHRIHIRAVEALGEIGTEEAIPQLLTLMEHANSYVRRNAAEALGKIGSEKVVSALLQLLEDTDFGVRRMATAALGEIGSEEATPALLKFMEDADFSGCYKAVHALGKIGSKEAIPQLLTLVESISFYVRRIAADAPSEIGNGEAIPALEINWMRSMATKVLGKIASKQGISTLLQLGKHTDPEVRWVAVNALGEVGSEEVIPALLQLVEDANFDVRWGAVNALGKIGNERAIPVLVELVEYPDSWLSWVAANGLSKIGSEQVISALLRLAEHTDSYVRENVAATLGEIGSEQAIPTLLQFLEDADSGVCRKAIGALGKIASKQGISALLQLGKHTDPEVRRLTVNALAEIGSEEAVPKLMQLVEDTNSQVREFVAEALGKVGNEDVIPALLQLVKDADCKVRWKTAEALGKVGNEDAIPVLLQLVKDAHIEPSYSAADALGQLAKKHQDVIVSHLPYLLTLIPTQFNVAANRAICAIQNHCKYYNHEIFQARLAAEKGKNEEQGSTTLLPTNVFAIETLHTPGAAINLGGTIQGNQIGHKITMPPP